MKSRWLPILGIGALLATAVVQPCEARVVKFVVDQTTPYLGGVSWGNAGSYELLRGTAYMEVDPREQQNRVIVDLDNAPRNAKGLVEFSTPFLILKPADMGHSNHKIFYAVNNRGNNLEGLLTATTQAAVAVTDAGAAMERGYTIVDAGWEGDLIPTATQLGAVLPIAKQPNGRSITGVVRYEYYDRAPGTYTTNLEGTPGFQSYPAADTNTAHATLTVRDQEDSKRIPIPSNQWAFGTCPTGRPSLVPDAVDLCYFPGFDTSKIYELIYQAKDPIVLALGFATTRDVASFLRHSTKDDFGNPNPIGAGTTRAYAAGGSQTGGYLRDFMYLGFNEDEGSRQVFDGIIPWIAGTDRVLINVRFADPNAYSEQDHQHDYLQNSYPPFTYAVTTDPLSGIHDGILKRPATDPKVMQVDTESEFWQLHDSLNVVNGLGRPVPVPDSTRLYFVGNTAHGFVQGGFLSPVPGTSTLCDDPTPGSGIGWETLRASLINLDAWVDKGIEPPASNYPSVTNDTLASVQEAGRAFPKIPSFSFPTVVNTYNLLLFGPFFNSLGGALTIVPPGVGPSYVILVPKTDGIGLQLAGVHAIEARVPIGTSTGWNIRSPGHRAPNLCSLTGSYFPFATTNTERRASGDPRPSLQQLYKSHAGFVNAVEKAAGELVDERFLLPEDAKSDIAAAQASDILR
jgi:hypothetical protein